MHAPVSLIPFRLWPKQASAGLHAVASPCAYLFCCIMHREILMDLNDTEGDRGSGINTLPVVLGRGAALAVALLLAVLAVGVSLHSALVGGGLSWLVSTCTL
jgi:4-hydroxybenzoate polyprenyltransferase